MNYGSICSGIEAATAAWHPLGFEPAWFSEIEKFPSAVLAHHYPNIKNLGDMTAISRRVLTGEVEAPDVLVGGTPCQAFSVAGLREGLDDPRGQLTISYVRLADATDFIRQRAGKPAAVIVWENVPGVLSDKTNAFGCLLGALAGENCELVPAGKRWTDAGCVYGPKRAIAWRILDAQYFGLAQRRRRVFLVASARKGFDPAAVLFESEGVRRDSPPCRESGENTTASTARSVAIRGREGGGTAELGDDIGLTLRASSGGGDKPHVLIASTGDISHCLNAGGMGRQDYETETVIVQCVTGDVTHTLKADGHDGSEDGTGRGTPIIAFSCKDHGADAADDLAPTLRAMNHSGSHANAGGQMAVAYAIQAGALRENPNSGPNGVGVQESIAYTIEARAEVQAVLMTGEFHGWENKADASPLLRRVRHEIGEEAFTQWGLGILDSLQSPEILQSALHGAELRQATFSRRWVVDCALSRKEDRSSRVMQSLREAGCERCSSQGWQSLEQLAGELGAYLSQLSQPGAQAERFMFDMWKASEGAWLLRQALSAVQKIRRSDAGKGKPAHGGMQVRRLTVEECEFLQGMPRGYTNIPVRGKPAADGPRYKSIGNSMAVACMRWIGMRIQRELSAQVRSSAA